MIRRLIDSWTIPVLIVTMMILFALYLYRGNLVELAAFTATAIIAGALVFVPIILVERRRNKKCG